MDDFEKGTIVYYAQILPTGDVYEVLTLKLRTVDKESRWFVGTDVKTKAAFLFNECDIGIAVFTDRKEALEKVKEAKKNRKERVLTTYCEEDN